ncbi:ABC transporter, partial [Klebsiella oxytoca]
LVHHPDDAFWFDGDRVLPTLVRSQVASNDASSLQLVAEPDIPRGLAILDAPDIDSVVTRNRDLAAQLLQAADLWV